LPSGKPILPASLETRKHPNDAPHINPDTNESFELIQSKILIGPDWRKRVALIE
jgi:hypothetical protein